MTCIYMHIDLNHHILTSTSTNPASAPLAGFKSTLSTYICIYAPIYTYIHIYLYLNHHILTSKSTNPANAPLVGFKSTLSRKGSPCSAPSVNRKGVWKRS